MNRFKRGIQPVAAVLLAAVLVGVPLWTVLVTAGKSQAEALSPDLSLPSHWQLGANTAEVVSGCWRAARGGRRPWSTPSASAGSSCRRPW